VMDPLPAIQDINPQVSDKVCAFVERLMAKKPDDRYQSATEIIEEVKRLQAGLDLGKDRIAGAETMILQRLARGEPGNPGNHTPGDHSTGRSTGVNVPANVETRRLRQVFMLGVAAVILFLIILLLPRFLPKDANDPQTLPDLPEVPTETLTPGTTVAPDPTQGLHRRLDAVEAALAARNEADLGEQQTEIERILAAGPSASQRTRAERLQMRIANAITERENSQREQAWSNLRTEVGRLAEERNYELALRRITAFPHRDHDSYRDRTNDLREQITRERDRFTTDLNERLTSYVARKDVVRLRDLRDTLPKALLGTDVEKRIADDIAKLEREAAQRQQGTVREIAEELIRFDVAKVEERHRLQRSTVTDAQLGAMADELLAAARALPALVDALNTTIRTSDARKMRFIGEIQRMRNPDLIGAGRTGLLVQAPVGSGEIEVAWRNIDLATLTAVIDQILNGGGDHRPVLDALTKAATLVGQ